VIKKKGRDLQGLTSEPVDPAQYPELSGVAGAKIVEPVPKFIKADHETDLSPPDLNAWIILGRDRHASRGSGYSGAGDTQCAAIDICVGRMADKPRDDVYVDPVFKDKKVPPRLKILPNGTVTGTPSFVASDAARIYISQKTNIDKNFGLKFSAQGVQPSRGKSGIGIKADAVRIIGREGIKLVTGADMKNSQGGELNSTAGIDLIAGNNANPLSKEFSLEPLVKGDKLRDCLANLSRKIDKLASQLDSSLKTQMKYNQALATHFHNSPFYGGTTTTSIPVQAPAIKAQMNHLQQNVTQLSNFRRNMSNWRKNFLLPSGGKFINSRWNRTN
jgi:hypothetical protein